MAITPQTNTTLADLARELQKHDDFVICGHVSPDGDCVGSQLALMHALRQLGKRCVCVFADNDGAIDDGLHYLPGACELMPPASCTGPVGVFVGVDVPTVKRIGDAAALHGRAQLRVTVDHHAVDEPMADLVYVDSGAASTSMLVWELAGCMLEKRSVEVAQCAYTGLLTDSGGFQFQNTDAAAFRAACEMVECGADVAAAAREVLQSRSLPSLQLEARMIERMRFGSEGATVISWLSKADFEQTGAVKADAEPLVNTLRAVKGVRIACILREQEASIRGSLRAKDDTDVSGLARAHGGGGHKAAAGFTMHGEVADAVEQMLAEMDALAHSGAQERTADETAGGASRG